MVSPLVVVRWEDQHCRRQLQDFLEQALIESMGTAGWKIGAARAADEQCITSKNPVVHHQAHRILCVTRRVDRLQSKITHNQHVSVVKPQIDERCWAQAMCDDQSGHDLAKFPAGREVIGVSMCINDVTDMQSQLPSYHAIIIEQAQLRIDEHRLAGRLAPYKIGLAAANQESFEDHFTAPGSPALWLD